MIREKFSGDLKRAIEAKDAPRAAVLRLVSAAIKDREAGRRSEGDDAAGGPDDAEVVEILERMIRQREASARAYEEAGRLELAAEERGELRILQEYLPKQMTEAEVGKAVAAAITDTRAQSIRDLAKVMAHLKGNYSGRMDFARACLAVKRAFG